MISMCGWILSVKVLLISAGVVSLAVGLRFSVPVAVDVIPAIWSGFLSCLKPPYLYLVINGIIITIAASSRFHQSQPETQQVGRSENLVSVKSHPPVSFETFPAQLDISAVVEEPVAAAVVLPEIEDAVVESRSVTMGGSEVDVETPDEIAVSETEGRDVFVVDSYEYNSTSPAPEATISKEIQLESLFPVREKPLVTTRFGHRKPSRTNPEGGRALRVARAKKHETLENTWKMITEGRHVPLKRHLKKSDAFEHVHVEPAAAPVPARIGKETSLGQDELNRRVEAFIKKFNEEMRMQRQESLNQYMEMINRGL